MLNNITHFCDKPNQLILVKRYCVPAHDSHTTLHIETGYLLAYIHKKKRMRIFTVYCSSRCVSNIFIYPVYTCSETTSAVERSPSSYASRSFFFVKLCKTLFTQYLKADRDGSTTIFDT